MGSLDYKKLFIVFLSALNSGIIILLILIIPYMRSHGIFNMAFISIPFLIFLFYVLIKRFKNLSHHYSDSNDERHQSIQKNKIMNIGYTENKDVIIHYKHRQYQFSILSIIFLPIGVLLTFISIFWFFDLEVNQWLEEIVIKQSVFLTNSLFNINTQVFYNLGWRDPWYIMVTPPENTVHINTLCTAIGYYLIFAGIIFFTPKSLINSNKEDILWRKTTIFTLTVIIMYILNLFRIVFTVILRYYNIPFSIIIFIVDYSITIIIVIIFSILLLKRLPEFYISIFYSYLLVSHKLKSKYSSNR